MREMVHSRHTRDSNLIIAKTPNSQNMCPDKLLANFLSGPHEMITLIPMLMMMMHSHRQDLDSSPHHSRVLQLILMKRKNGTDLIITFGINYHSLETRDKVTLVLGSTLC